MISFKNAERCHRRMWEWLAKTGVDKKTNWVEFHIPNPKNGRKIIFVSNGCFACKVALRNNCRLCPINWDGNGGGCCSIRSPYQKWEHAQTAKTRKKYAAIIRDMPWEKKR